MSSTQRVIARAAQTRPRVPNLAPSKSTRGACAGRRAVGQGCRPRSGYLRILGELSGTRPRFCDPCGQRPRLEPSRDREARWAIIFRGTQRSPLGRVYISLTPKAEIPCAHGALMCECYRRGVECPLAPGIRAEQKAPHQMYRCACLGSHRPRSWR